MLYVCECVCVCVRHKRAHRMAYCLTFSHNLTTVAHDKLLNVFRNNHHSGNFMSLNPMVGPNLHNGIINSLFIDFEYDVYIYIYEEFQAITT